MSLNDARVDRLNEAERHLVEDRRRHVSLVNSSEEARLRLEETLDALGKTRAERRALRALVASVEGADRDRTGIERMREELFNSGLLNTPDRADRQ
ncbi:hypothetical protein, partial [Escherichia coli]|uniref:hypothetical protein n=1 Tax=Escherichia coli TaxID=562 RepID=UPI0011E8E8D5